LPGLVAQSGGTRLGPATFSLKQGECEVVSLDVIVQAQGIGASLVREVEAAARQADDRRLWLITIEDNPEALRFYHRRGFRPTTIHREAIAHSRELKPCISETSPFGIPLRDEIELEL
jgi:GNAT superfamily N-acetyltransferase